jgi:hypothetical protein
VPVAALGAGESGRSQGNRPGPSLAVHEGLGRAHESGPDILTTLSALTLGAISLPAGFSLAAGFGQATLAPGQSTTFAPYSGAGWHSDLFFKQAGSGAEAATWTFSGLAPIPFTFRGQGPRQTSS